MLQGGKEAARSNEILHRLIVEAIEDVAPEVPRCSPFKYNSSHIHTADCCAPDDSLEH